ncbi:bile acid:sodium symporter family protein [Persicitalea jodogahamensis]|uniref:bile acid:sodium symporter family protein n=1 Tax=Persicitalea jodogahamensis TaxID=402147 RepID=UPI001E464C4F|nr:bile acid:sodium symporter family protein [Persicitalea jodogahamensis]
MSQPSPSTTKTFWSAAQRAGLDGFILALITVVFLAWLWPFPGTASSPVPLGTIAGYGVSVIFFFYGLKLNLGQLRTGLSNPRLHLLIHTTTFLLFPLIILAIKPLFQNPDLQTLWLGIFFLAALPGTVSSAVVMVSLAGGNIPAAIFNASLSSLLGVFITPLWMGLLMNTTSASFDMEDVVLKLVVQVLVPVVAGMLLHRFWGAFAEKYRKQLGNFDKGVILLIVYTSFCESFDSGVFSLLGWQELLLLWTGMVVLFFLIYGITTFVGKLFRFSREEHITASFCGSKKSLVQGAVMSKVLFAGLPSAGILLLPILLYHASQLLIVSSIAQRMSREKH